MNTSSWWKQPMFSILTNTKNTWSVNWQHCSTQSYKRNATKAVCPLSQLPDMVNNTYTMACCSVSFFWYGFFMHPSNRHTDTYTHTQLHLVQYAPYSSLLPSLLWKTFSIQYLLKVINNSKQLNVSNKIQWNEVCKW